MNAGDITATDNFVTRILVACQDLLENEMELLEPLLGVLTVCGVRFSQRLEPYFSDVVDLLLGWALDPDHPEGDRRLIVDNFLKFHRMWARNPEFPLSLLKKFLGDMETLAHDHSTPTVQQLYRLLALASCFVAVMQATALGMDEADPNKHQASMTDSSLPSEQVQYMEKEWKEMLPRVISCFAILGNKFWHFRWLNEACRCLSLFAEVLKESFAEFYTSVLEILFPMPVSDNKMGGRQQHASLGLTLAQAPPPLTAHQVCFSLRFEVRQKKIFQIGSYLQLFSSRTLNHFLVLVISHLSLYKRIRIS